LFFRILQNSSNWRNGYKVCCRGWAVVLPNGLAGPKEIFRFIAEQVSLETYLNIMDQNHHAHQAYRKVGTRRRVSKLEYLDVIHYVESMGMPRLDKRTRFFTYPNCGLML
jgi:uncharacterized Fe-S radical SAM superfamily protein PflX